MLHALSAETALGFAQKNVDEIGISMKANFGGDKEDENDNYQRNRWH